MHKTDTIEALISFEKNPKFGFIEEREVQDVREQSKEDDCHEEDNYFTPIEEK